MGKALNLVGQKFGILLVLERGLNNKNSKTSWICLCECGHEKVVSGVSLKSGHTKSCGCKQTTHTHDLSQSTEYKIWENMKTRCTNEKVDRFKDYGGRGIKVCDRWMDSFEAFLKDMGFRPSMNHSLDRKDVNGNYEPNNCKWSTILEQSRNKRTSKLNTSGLSGVNSNKEGKWRVRIGLDNKRIHIGYFNTLEEAILARENAEKIYWNKSS